MLSRTAYHLYWMARYIERAENNARMLDANHQASLLPQSADRARAAWRGLLGSADLEGRFTQRYGEVTPASVMRYMVCDEANPSSIASCLRAARENARAVRGVITTEVWEAENTTWLGFCQRIGEGALQRDPAGLLDWVQFRAHLGRGVRLGTMLQNEALHFLHIGTFLERADNTARLLAAKLREVGGEAGMPCAGPQALEVDFYYWATVLRSVCAYEFYRKVYRNVIRPEKVAELLLLCPEMPCSLLACVNQLTTNLERVANDHSAESLRRARQLQSDLRRRRLDEILDAGLQAYLGGVIGCVAELGLEFGRDFMMPAAA